MSHFLRHRNTRLYFTGQGLILLGAWGLEATGSFLPLALAASAGVMLSMPLVKDRFARAKAAPRR